MQTHRHAYANKPKHTHTHTYACVYALAVCGCLCVYIDSNFSIDLFCLHYRFINISLEELFSQIQYEYGLIRSLEWMEMDIDAIL